MLIKFQLKAKKLGILPTFAYLPCIARYIPAKLLEVLKIAHGYSFPITAYSDSQESEMPDGD